MRKIKFHTANEWEVWTEHKYNWRGMHILRIFVEYASIGNRRCELILTVLGFTLAIIIYRYNNT